jgi:hypothetical protein
MNILKKVFLASAFIGMSVTASASTIDVGGVTWDPDYEVGLPSIPASDLTMKGNFAQFFVNAADAGTYDPSKAKSVFAVVAGDELQGSGRYTAFNGLTNPDLGGVGFCHTCELTYEFGGLISDGAGSFTYGSAFFRVYVETGADIDGMYTKSAASPANLWLDLSIDSLLFSSGSNLGAYVSGEIKATFSAVGGMAQGNFDTNTIDNQIGGLADIFYTANAIFDVHFDAGGNRVTDPALAGTVVRSYASTNTGNFVGQTIPEPTTLAIFGLSILGLAASKRRKQA